MFQLAIFIPTYLSSQDIEMEVKENRQNKSKIYARGKDQILHEVDRFDISQMQFSKS